jgi:5,6,7,8-tetrahydromethanopterin hydro-lyase
MAERIVLRTGEALVEAEQGWSAAEPEVIIGELDGPVGQALATLLGDQVKGQVKPATLMVSKVTVNDNRYTSILMGTVQAAIANGVLDAVRSGDIPKARVNDLGIIISVWLDPAVLDAEDLDHRVLFQTHREATAKALRKAMRQEPTIDWLLENQDKVVHYYHQLGLDGQL